MSKIKLTNDVIIDSSSLGSCVDPTNVLVDRAAVTSYTWTATADCICFTISAAGPTLVDNVQVNSHGTATSGSYSFIVRKGSVVKCAGYNGWTSYYLKAFGLK